MTSQENGLFLTVFTPTYNRGKLLHRGYTSLVNQTYRNFEWVIIDDGSTDNTKEVVDRFMAEGKLNIRYYYQENAGKHGAYNNVLQQAKGTFLLVLDSDDAFRENALEILVNHWQQIPDGSKEQFIGVTGLCEDQHGNLIGDRFPASPFDSNSVEKYYKYDIKGDKCGMMKLSILKQYRFPDKKASFYPEAYLWFTIGKQFKTRYINEIILTYYLEAKDSLSKPAAIQQNTAGVMSDYYLFLINNFLKYCQYKPVEFLKYFVFYSSYAAYAGHSFPQIIRHINNPFSKLVGILLYPVSYYHYNKKLNAA